MFDKAYRHKYYLKNKARLVKYMREYNQRPYVKKKRVIWIREYRKTHPEYSRKRAIAQCKRSKFRYKNEPKYRKMILEASTKYYFSHKEARFCKCGVILKPRHKYCALCSNASYIKSHRIASLKYERAHRGD